MTHLPKNTQRGFSLTELLVVALIVTAVTTMAVLNSIAIFPNYKANSAMNQVLGQLRAARQQAISHRREGSSSVCRQQPNHVVRTCRRRRVPCR